MTRRVVVDQMEKDSGMKRFPWTSSVASEEWLGAESHLPNLKQELRKQSHRGWNTAEIVVAGALFTAGLTLGSLAALWLTRSRQTD
jgi:hypothetical protein